MQAAPRQEATRPRPALPHSSAVAAGEMGGSLTAHSEGPGRGATFTLELPLQVAPAR